MISLSQKTSSELCKDMAEKLAAIRKRKSLSQSALAEKSGVSFGSLKRFEQTGEISLQSLCKIAIALGIEEELENLFAEVPFESIEEVIHGQNK